MTKNAIINKTIKTGSSACSSGTRKKTPEIKKPQQRKTKISQEMIALFLSMKLSSFGFNFRQ